MSSRPKEAMDLRNSKQYLEAAERLIKINEDQPGLLTCGDVNCNGVYCRHCPLTPAAYGREANTSYNNLGELRAAMDRVERGQKIATSEPEATESKPTATSDVRQPSHYKLFQDVESIEVIARSMTVEQFHGFCFGNILKYRLRAGKKSELATMEKDLAKAAFYETLFEQHKGKCHE